MSKYLEFKVDGSGTIIVISKNQKMELGEIIFYIPWEQYVFVPLSHAIFSDECLENIIQVIKDKNEEKK